MSFNCTHLGGMMPMLPYPPSMKPDAAENSWLRALGGTLALLSILLTLLGIILHQRVPDLILAIIVGMFARIRSGTRWCKMMPSSVSRMLSNARVPPSARNHEFSAASGFIDGG